MTLTSILITSVVLVAISIALVISDTFRQKIGDIARNVYLQAALVTLLVFTAGLYIARVSLIQDDVLQSIRERGYLNCGINGDLLGFSEDAKGFDADFCRVVAAAIFEDAEDPESLDNKIEFISLTTTRRFEAIERGEIDILIRNTTWNVGRVLEENIDFGPIIFLDSQGFFAKKESGVEILLDLDGKSVCVLPNTTTVDNLNNLVSDTLMTEISFGELITTTTGGANFVTNRDIFFDYIKPEPKCDVVTSDKSQLYAISKGLGLNLNNGDYTIIPPPDIFITKEPLSPVFIGNDKVWRDIVTYSIYATIHASELGINSTNLAEYDQTDNLVIKKFLGIDDPNIQYHIGDALGLCNKNFVQNIIRYVGNYDEIYARNLDEIIPERGVNRTWKDGGILISPPFETPKALRTSCS